MQGLIDLLLTGNKCESLSKPHPQASKAWARSAHPGAPLLKACAKINWPGAGERKQRCMRAAEPAAGTLGARCRMQGAQAVTHRPDLVVGCSCRRWRCIRSGRGGAVASVAERGRLGGNGRPIRRRERRPSCTTKARPSCATTKVASVGHCCFLDCSDSSADRGLDVWALLM